MTLGDFVDVYDSVHPIWVQKGVWGTHYKDVYELIERNETGVYGRDWDFDEEIEYITLDGENELTIELKEA